MQDNDDLQSVWNNGAPSKLTVGGVPFEPHNASDEDILHTIKALPGNLSNRARISTSLSYSPTSPAAESEYAAYQASNEFGRNGDYSQLQSSIDHYIQAAEQYEEMGMLKPAANMYSLAAQSYINFPYNVFEQGSFLSEKAIECYDKAIALHDVQGHEDFSYRDRDKRYNAIAETVLAYRESPVQDISEEESGARAYHYYNRLRPEASELLHSSRRIQGELDHSALRVEQKEIGISDRKSIGTDNVSQCVTLIIRSSGQDQNGVPQNPVVALAHIDYETDAESIDQMFEKLPDGHREARILGARFDQDIKSVENLVKVIKALAAYEVDVISSNVYQGDQGPSTVIVNPFDFSMRESVPTADKGMAEASCAYSLITEDKTYPLRLAFDTREGEDRAPLYLTQQMVQKIRENYLDKDDVERYKAIRDEGLFDIGLSSHFFNSLVKQYEKSIEDIVPYAASQLPDEVIEEMPIYIGKDALAKNIDLVEDVARVYQQGGNINTLDYDN
ncbi:MAG: hypothetical protein ACTHOO_10565 [Alcanivorax sp.]